MQQVSFAIRKEQDVSRPGSRPDQVGEFDPAAFKFCFGTGDRINFQSQVTKTRRAVIRSFRLRYFRRINLQPDITQ